MQLVTCSVFVNHDSDKPHCVLRVDPQTETAGSLLVRLGPQFGEHLVYVVTRDRKTRVFSGLLLCQPPFSQRLTLHVVDKADFESSDEPPAIIMSPKVHKKQRHEDAFSVLQDWLLERGISPVTKSEVNARSPIFGSTNNVVALRIMGGVKVHRLFFAESTVASPLYNSASYMVLSFSSKEECKAFVAKYEALRLIKSTLVNHLLITEAMRQFPEFDVHMRASKDRMDAFFVLETTYKELNDQQEYENDNNPVSRMSSLESSSFERNVRLVSDVSKFQSAFELTSGLYKDKDKLL